MMRIIRLETAPASSFRIGWWPALLPSPSGWDALLLNREGPRGPMAKGAKGQVAMAKGAKGQGSHWPLGSLGGSQGGQ